MADPASTQIPQLLGVTLDGTGVANTQVTALNTTTGEKQTLSTSADKQVVFDAANFTSGYTNGDVIEFENVGASKGENKLTIDTFGDFQTATISCTAALTIAIDL